MRWDNLRLTGDDESHPDLPLIERQAVTRTFDTPEFRGITFYEIHAKSIINKVPPASRLGFTWTINPYRGCTHACAYCLTGDTPILMADGRTKPLADVGVGDRIYGTERRGDYRRYVVTEVLAHWRTIKPAYRISLEDGTELIASGDHRFLSDRGWKFVTGAQQGSEQRPHLTLNNKLIGTGEFAEGPKDTAEYRRGYLRGMIRGGGYIGSYSDEGNGSVCRCRLALIDADALRRTRSYLADFGVTTTEFIFQKATSHSQPINAIRNSTKAGIAKIERIIEWPWDPSDDWRKGFLAGIFDAEGSCRQGVLRISNSDPPMLAETQLSLRRLGFTTAVDGPTFPGKYPVMCIRLVGGLRERLRFFHTVDPAIARKRSIEGTALKSDAPLKVVSIEPLGLDLPMYDITTGTGDFIANGVVSHNCFARKSHEYLELDAGRDFDSKIVVKVNAPELVRKELAAPKWAGEHIAMGTNVDVYQRAEGRYRLMPGILAALRDAANPFSILTKGSLILRDLPLLEEAAERTDVSTAVSVGSVDRDLWRLVEPGTPSPQKRLEVCATLNEHGIRCGVLMGPVIPYLSDSPAELEEAVRLIAETGTPSVSAITLHLRPGAREWFFRWLREHHPDLVPRYERMYGRGAYAPKDVQERISRQVRELAEKYGIDRRGRGDHRSVAPPEPPTETPEQLTLL
jgi:DNA repair photolyase